MAAELELVEPAATELVLVEPAATELVVELVLDVLEPQPTIRVADTSIDASPSAE